MRIAALALAILFALTGCGMRPPEKQQPQVTEAPYQAPSGGAPEGATAVGPYPGNRAPSIAAVRVDTLEPFGLGELRGKVVLLNFFATWCLPCRDEMPAMQKVADEMAGKLAVVAIGADIVEKPDLLRQFAESLGVTFPVLFDEAEAARRYRVLGLPASLFIDGEGYVRARVEGPLTENLIRQQVDKITGGSS